MKLNKSNRYDTICFSDTWKWSNGHEILILTAMAWLIIPHNWSLSLFNGSFVFNSWRLYMSFCGLPIIVGAMCFFFYPESPKFLMSQGRNDEALHVFRKIYAVNSGQSPNSYPVLENPCHIGWTDQLTKNLKQLDYTSYSFKFCYVTFFIRFASWSPKWSIHQLQMAWIMYQLRVPGIFL